MEEIRSEEVVLMSRHMWHFASLSNAESANKNWLSGNHKIYTAGRSNLQTTG